MEDACWAKTFLCRTFSLTKCNFNSICFVLACNIILVTMLRLKHQIAGGVGKMILNFERKYCNQTS